jgi:serine/threonine-protein kinase
VENVAASVADGAPVDWRLGGVPLSAREQRLVGHLKTIETLAEVFRTLPPAAGDLPEFAPVESPEPKGPRWGRLVLLDRLGRGSSADVFRAWDVDLEREVALKLLYDDGLTQSAAVNARILQEARRLARVHHPHVVHVYGAERHDGRVGLWMELVRGRTIDDIVRDTGPMAADDAARAAADVCGALSAVHGAGLLHRDVKAQNVIRDEGGRFVLMDFGTGEDINNAPARMAGTPLYLAPEIFAGARASVASDVYSAGVLLFYALSGEFPVRGGSVEALAAAHRAGEQRSISSTAHAIPHGLVRIVDRALDPDPRNRFSSTAEMERELRLWLERGAARAMSWRTWGLVVGTAAVVALLVSTLTHRHPATTALAPATSIAVLPLAYESGQDQAPFLADALTDELITTLGHIPSLRVTAHRSVARFKGAATPVSDIAQTLGVGSVLEGTVSVGGGSEQRVHVNLRLIRAGTDLELWSESFDRPLANLIAVQEQIARAVAHSVRATLTPEESDRLQRPPQVGGPAERAYLEAVYYLSQNRHGAEVRPALESIRKAITLEPSFAAAHAVAAKTYILLGFDEEIPQIEAARYAKEEANRAIALEPNLAGAHAALADVNFYYEWDWTSARAEYERALDLDPSDVYARTQYARVLAALGQTDAARREAEIAARVDPLSADAVLTTGLMAYYQRRFDEAAAILQRAIRMDPRFAGAYVTMGRIEEARGRLPEAIAFTDRAIDLAPNVPWRAEAARLRGVAGDRQTARKALRQLKAAHLDAPYEAYIRLALGVRDAALDLLTGAIDERVPAVLWLRVDPRLDPLRDNPRFRALVVGLGHP